MVAKRLTVLLPLLALAALWAPSSAGAVGELSLRECFGSTVGCINEAGEPLALSGGVAVSPSGTAVYATGKESVTHFFVGTDGDLAYDGCVSNDGSSGNCANAGSAAQPLRTATGVVVSPARQAVYVAAKSVQMGAGTPGDVAQLETLVPGGQLVYRGCVSNKDGSGNACGVTNQANPLERATGVAVSPDGNSVYAAAAGGVPGAGFVDHFFVSPTGGLSFDGCVASFSTASCAPFGSEGAPLGEASAVAVSPVSGDVYVAAPENDAVAHLSTDADGRLFPGNCVAGAGANGKCEDAPGSLPEEDRGIAVSPDGKSVYVTSATAAGGITRLSVLPGGDLRWAECLTADGSGGVCKAIPGTGDPLARANAVAVSPDGLSLYVGGERAVTAFALGSDGAPSYQACYSGEFVEGCTDLTGKPIEEATGIAISPDGASVYVSSSAPGMLAHLSRVRPTPPAPPPAGGGSGPGTTAPIAQAVTTAAHVFTAAELKASLLAQLVPRGKAAKPAKLERSKGYPLSFKALVAGSLTIDWFFLPKGAHVSVARKHKAKPKPVLFAAGRASFGAASTKPLTISLTAKALGMLRHRSSIELTVKGTFAPRGGAAVSAVRSFQLKG